MLSVLRPSGAFTRSWAKIRSDRATTAEGWLSVGGGQSTEGQEWAGRLRIGAIGAGPVESGYRAEIPPRTGSHPAFAGR